MCTRIYRNKRAVLDLHLLSNDELKAVRKAVDTEWKKREKDEAAFLSLLDLPSFVHLNLEQAEKLQEHNNG